MFRTVNALILREVRFREADRILTALTANLGKITLSAHGALGKKSRLAAATQQLTYAELTLFEKNGRYTVREAVTKEGFPGLRSELDRLALGAYFAECLEQYAGEGQPEAELMQLGLNCLYALSEGLAECDRVKAAFELRLTAAEGYAPEEAACHICGRPDIREPVFLPEEGYTVCRACRQNGRGIRLSDGALSAMRFILHAPAKKILSFRIDEESLRQLSEAAETWFLHCSGRNFSTLNYYRNLKM